MKLETIRHSLAHVMALAVQELYPEAVFGMGPAIENGFYYDFDLSLTEQDLKKIEKKMRQLMKQNLSFKKEKVELKEAKKIFKNQPYKLDLIKDIKDITIYTLGNFTDLCQGPHVSSTAQLPSSFRLERIAGAYWKGDEKNPMLTRIYGLAFENEKELKEYEEKIAEAERRDHRVLGKKMDLYHIDEDIGPGLIIWHPKGAMLKRLIETYTLDTCIEDGYQLLSTPHLAKLKLWKTSGHCDFYSENMFPPLKMDNEFYQVKPMNCPFHMAVYKTHIHSYRDLPIRYAEIGTVYRYEKSGTLHGLTRVRSISQDDGHIFCRPDQLEDELYKVLQLTKKILKKFGLKKFYAFLSTRPEKSIGTDNLWKKAEISLKKALKKAKLDYQTDQGGGAFYGPKIDLKIKDALGREWQCTTIQLDFNLPERFDIYYINEKGEKERPLILHRAILGALERFTGVLLEYHGGELPLWLAPIQARIVPVSRKHLTYAKKVKKSLDLTRIEIDDSDESLGKKIRKGLIEKIPYLLVVGDEEKKNNTVAVKLYGRDKQPWKI